MSTLALIIVFNFLGSFVSLIGGILLLIKKSITEKIAPLLVAFAAGSMLSVSFFDLLPEALESAEQTNVTSETIFMITLVGIVSFFLIERFILWSHHHHGKNIEETHPTIPLLIIGDTIHNFLDGVTIAATFLVSIPLGIVTTFAVGAHEIPQEIGDFATLLHEGLTRKSVILVNIFSAFSSFLGAILAYFLLQTITGLTPLLLGFAAGNFLYISSSDLIPEIHRVYRREKALTQTAFFLLGIFVVWFSIKLLEG